ncbi:hypothetical protein [Allosalinactinospora lopnorensis]|uniref:hypothetical protein n=1 Tax=Allosalinactinospora lopnorensis TaxID=1352348 RepID=UPI0012E0DFB1|nr:hypothetical protein [Allosalinactinospora lopnorensis]
MTIYAILLYAVPLVCIVTTVYVGFLGFRFYVDEVVRHTVGDAASEGSNPAE